MAFLSSLLRYSHVQAGSDFSEATVWPLKRSPLPPSSLVGQAAASDAVVVDMVLKGLLGTLQCLCCSRDDGSSSGGSSALADKRRSSSLVRAWNIHVR